MTKFKIPFYETDIPEESYKLVEEVINSGFLTTGTITKNVEKEISTFTKNKFAVGLSSCTSGLFLILDFINVKNKKVAIPSFTFVATANAVLHAGGIPVFIDIKEDTGLLDLKCLEAELKSNKIDVVIPVHLFGQMVDMKKLQDLSTKYRFKIIEDAAHCYEGFLGESRIRPGNLSFAAVFSFYATKNVTSAEGGCAVTNNKELYNYLLISRLHGMSKSALSRTNHYEHWDLELLGYKFNLSDFQSALLLPQLKNIDTIFQKRTTLSKIYYKYYYKYSLDRFSSIFKVNKGSANHLWVIKVPPKIRDSVISDLQKAGINITVNYNPVHLTSFYKRYVTIKNQSVCELPVTERVGASVISLPFYTKLLNPENSEKVLYLFKSLEVILKERTWQTHQ